MEFEAGAEEGVQPEVFLWKHATKHAEHTGSSDSTPSTELSQYDLSEIFDGLGELTTVEHNVEADAGSTSELDDTTDALDGTSDFSFEECMRWFERISR